MLLGLGVGVALGWGTTDRTLGKEVSPSEQVLTRKPKHEGASTHGLAPRGLEGLG